MDIGRSADNRAQWRGLCFKPGMPRRSPRSSYFYWRVLALLAVLGGALALYLLSRADDPRFYYVLTTPAGRLLAQCFGWQRDLGPAVRPDRPEADWDPEDRVVKYQWERELTVDAPLHRLILQDGLRLKGRLLAQDRNGILFQEAAGEGGLTQSYARERVARVDTLDQPAYAVSYRDVQLRRELPEFHFLKRAPFTVATDGPEAEIREALQALRDRFAELSGVFAELVDRPPVRTDFPVIFCGREGAFRTLRDRYAPEAEHAVGFYVVWLDRLYLLNFDSADSRRSVTERVLMLERQYQERQRERGAPAADWVAWRERTLQRIHAAARRETLATIRHEGAHQFMHTTGVHSDYRAENDWLVEGLATWCELPVLGQPDAMRVDMLMARRRAGLPPALPALVNARRFATLGERPDVSYAWSLLLVDWLMQPSQRAAFFRYVRWQRDPAHVSLVATEPAWTLLARELDLSPALLETKVLEHLDKLAGPPLPRGG